MTITVAIPTYNKEKYIDSCIQSVLQQKSFVNEIIVIDNCSTDKTFEFAKRYEPQVRCICNSTNIGMAGNWNRCIELCQSDLLLILHADDELLPGALKLYLDFFARYPNLGLVHANFYFIRNKDDKTKVLMDSRFLEISKTGPEAMSMAKGYACSTVVVPKKVYEKLGGFIESMSSDLEMFKRIGAHYDIGQIDQATACVSINNDSAGRKSLINRTVEEIVNDANNLSARIVGYYPPELQDEMKKGFKNSTAGLLVLVFGRNFKAGNYRKAFQALAVSIFKYQGFWVFVKTITLLVTGKLRLWPKKEKEGS